MKATKESNKKMRVGAHDCAQKGITLIALVITIIVMLILVAVTISMAVNGGLFNYAGKAVGDTKNALNAEQQLANGGITIVGKYYNSIDEYLKGGTDTVGDIEIKLTMVSTPTEVTADGTYVDKIKEGVPIPKGFYYAGGTKNTGVVISDAVADENTTNTTVPDTLTGNQFVWVPVLQNQKLKIKIKSKEPITDIILENEYREIIEQDTLNTAIGKTSYSVEIVPEINGSHFLTVWTGNAIAAEQINIVTLYANDPFEGDIKTREEILMQSYGATSGSELAKMLKEYALQQGVSEDALLESYFGEGTTLESAWINILASVDEQYQKQPGWCYDVRSDETVQLYTPSVDKYGGFYIARYEAGSESAREYGSDASDAVYSKKNMYPYNWINQVNAISKASTMYENKTNITTALVNQAAWDRTLNWLFETNAITEAQLLTDSTDWGNYGSSYMTFTGKYYSTSWNETISEITEPTDSCYLLGTGISEKTRKNNIYDLAGNCCEWSTEECDSSSSPIMMTGGIYDSTFADSDYVTVYDSFAENGVDAGLSFRPALYIEV